MTELLDIFSRAVSLPGDLSREERVALVLEAGTAWTEGREPSARARLFTATAIVACLRRGGDVMRDYWRIAAPRGSHRTPDRIAADLIGDERQKSDEEEHCAPVSTEDL